MNIEWQTQGDETPVLTFSGPISFSLENKLLALLESEHLPPAPSTIVADLAKVESMDSSALGMLLILRDRIGRRGHQVMLCNCPPAALEKLRIAHFHTLFEIAA